MNELKDFIEISKYAGERYDLIQAGGGNSSVKNEDGTMYIKSSGVYLSEVSENYGYSLVNNKELLKIVNDKKIYPETDTKKLDIWLADVMAHANLTPNFRPSIETLLHSMLKKYVLHSHPIAVNAITNRYNWKEVLTQLFGNNLILVDYKTPGLSLALELKNQIKNKDPKVIFLQNHGLIVTSDNKDDIKDITESILNTIENYLHIDLAKYKLTSEVSKLINDHNEYKYVAYLSQDAYLNQAVENGNIFFPPCCPDTVVYCGIQALKLANSPQPDIQTYKKNFLDIPKVILYKKHLFFIAKNIKKAKEAEEVFKSHVLSINANKDKNIHYLPEEEIKYIGNWEAEKYRQGK